MRRCAPLAPCLHAAIANGPPGMKVSPAMSGLKVRIDGQGNVDTAHLGKQLEQKAKDKVSNFIWGLVIGVWLLVTSRTGAGRTKATL